MRRNRSITIQAHPELYSKMEKIRLYYRDKMGINLSQTAQTSIIANSIKVPKLLHKIDLIGGTINVKKSKR